MAAPKMTTEETRALIRSAPAGTIHPALQAQLDERKAINAAAAKMAGLNWGKALDWDTRRAVAEWARRFGVDAATDIQVLGGNVYLTAQYFMRRAAGMIERGQIEYLTLDHIEHDERLTQLGTDGEHEAKRRLAERIKYQVPDKAASAVVCRVKLRTMTQEITGCKWAGNGTRKGDPVGDAFPVESAETRAARRALRQVITHVPELAHEFAAMDTAGEDVGQMIEERKAAARIAEQETAARLPAGHGGMVAEPDAYEYGGEPLDADTLRAMADANPDPYGIRTGTPDDADEPTLALDEAPRGARRGRNALAEG